MCFLTYDEAAYSNKQNWKLFYLIMYKNYLDNKNQSQGHGQYL